jgi:broad specificity phosphatase PhoE
MNARKSRFIAPCLLLIATFAMTSLGQQKPADPATTAPADDANVSGTETLVFLRHGEKPPHGLGQINAQGLNRALALATVLPAKYGKPDYLFAPDPGQTIADSPKISYNYVRPLATIEPTAVSLEMPVQTPFGYRQIDKLNEELSKLKYARAVVFIAWEHAYEAKAVGDLVKQFGGDPKQVPAWGGNDFDSLYVVKITRTAGQPATVSFTHDHEGLDHLSKTMPVPATN